MQSILQVELQGLEEIHRSLGSLRMVVALVQIIQVHLAPVAVALATALVATGKMVGTAVVGTLALVVLVALAEAEAEAQ